MGLLLSFLSSARIHVIRGQKSLAQVQPHESEQYVRPLMHGELGSGVFHGFVGRSGETEAYGEVELHSGQVAGGDFEVHAGYACRAEARERLENQSPSQPLPAMLGSYPDVLNRSP